MKANRKTTWKDAKKLRLAGLYRVKLDDGTEHTAEFLPTTDEAPAWWHYPAGRPDDERKTRVPLTGVKEYGNPSAEDLKDHQANLTTLRERLDALYEQHVTSFSICPDFAPVIPANRQLKPGDEVDLGRLKDVKVVELRRDGQDVIVQYHALSNEYGVLVDHGTQYRVAYWTDLVPLSANRHVELSRAPLLYDAYRASTLRALITKAKMGLDDSPDYQRGYVWTEMDKENYLASIFEGRELGRFLFVERKYPLRDQVLDGKQRLACVMDFYTGAITYKGLYWHELSSGDRTTFENRSVQFAELPEERLGRATLLRIFLEVNAAGVPQAEDHLDKVRALLSREEARTYLLSLDTAAKLGDLYDDDPELRTAMASAFEAFEYPDYSHQTVENIIRKMDRIAEGLSFG